MENRTQTNSNHCTSPWEQQLLFFSIFNYAQVDVMVTNFNLLVVVCMHAWLDNLLVYAAAIYYDHKLRLP